MSGLAVTVDWLSVSKFLPPILMAMYSSFLVGLLWFSQRCQLQVQWSYKFDFAMPPYHYNRVDRSSEDGHNVYSHRQETGYEHLMLALSSRKLVSN